MGKYHCLNIIVSLDKWQCSQQTFSINDIQVYAWEIADQLLLLKRDIETSYFGAQTMQKKVRFSFDELPKDLHVVSGKLHNV